MGTKALTTALFKTYNYINGGLLGYFHKEAKAFNEKGISDRRALTSYLRRWGFATQLEKNPAMDKVALKVWINKTDPRRVHSWAYTGGSYGEPLRVPYSRTRALIRTASILYFNQLGGYTIGEPYALIRAKDKAAYMKFLRNEMIIVPYDTSSKRIEDMVTELVRRRTVLLMGYPSVIYDMAVFLRENNKFLPGLRIRNIITVSEPLEPFKRNIIRDTFQCPLTDRYSNEEVGIIAQQKFPGDEYHINRHGLFVEVVDPSTLLPVSQGEKGKVLVTDIHNDLIPMIRYDTGDMAKACCYNEDNLISIDHILGRITEVITNPEGKPVSPLTIGPFIYKPLSKENKLVPYQFAQTGTSKYELRLKADSGDIGNALSGTILSGLKDLLGSNAEVSLILVKDIECLPSGKRPVFKNEIPAGSSLDE